MKPWVSSVAFVRNTFRPRAASAIAEKSLARRMAVARPMPWLAPVMIATDSGISTAGTPKRTQATNSRRSDFKGVRLEREVTGIEEPDRRLRNVALERFSPRRQEGARRKASQAGPRKPPIGRGRFPVGTPRRRDRELRRHPTLSITSSESGFLSEIVRMVRRAVLHKWATRCVNARWCAAGRRRVIQAARFGRRSILPYKTCATDNIRRSLSLV